MATGIAYRVSQKPFDARHREPIRPQWVNIRINEIETVPYQLPTRLRSYQDGVQQHC